MRPRGRVFVRADCRLRRRINVDEGRVPDTRIILLYVIHIRAGARTRVHNIIYKTVFSRPSTRQSRVSLRDIIYIILTVDVFYFFRPCTPFASGYILSLSSLILSPSRHLPVFPLSRRPPAQCNSIMYNNAHNARHDNT